MDSYRTEEEQVEAIKKFFKEYGTKVLVAVVVAAGAFFGIKSYQHNERSDREAASTYYNRMVEIVPAQGAVSDEDQPVFDAAYAALLKDFSDTTYASYAAFFKARMDVTDGNLDEAEKTLRWVVEQQVNDELVGLANLRLAKVLAANEKAEDALALVKQPQGGFASSYAETEGDILVQLGKNEEALTAYEKAEALRDGRESMTSRLLTMKIDSLKEGQQDKLHAFGASSEEAEADKNAE
ncbi:Uncharacterised protein [BD1-7 clade bacterium]|uniref:Ancillary SecYEG translocon subunit n=1 Tax=BD1-7 clade bacterium TaxID=2029982 RepID=A0A5S9MZV6_9GAMM|nr:Uncharacterised protein [BD1-7 clade bacterium]